MSYGEIGWVIFLAGLPFAHLLFKPLDPWHGQALWAQGWIVALFGMSLWNGVKWTGKNRPLGSLTIWLLLSYCWISFLMIKNAGIYPIGMLQGLSHFILILMFYMAASTTWTVEFVEKLLEVISYTALAVIAYGYLQVLSLDQFFTSVDQPRGQDIIGGTIGNPTHFGAYLSLVLPTLIMRKGLWWKVSVALCYILIILTQSSTALFVSSITLTYFLFRANTGLGIAFIFTLICATYVVMAKYAAIWLNPYGRLEVWPQFYEIFKETNPITGNGIGYLMEVSKTIKDGPLLHWRHAHNEYLQIAIETGIVGLGICLWMIKDTVSMSINILYKQAEIKHVLGAIFFTFLFLCLFSFPMHLWLLGTLGLVSYCGIRTLAPIE